MESDAIFAVVNGVPPDEGVMVELGMAIARKKPTFLFRDDVRRVAEGDDYPLNLMLFTGLPEDGWQDSYYTSVEEITAPQKALARWAKEPVATGAETIRWGRQAERVPCTLRRRSLQDTSTGGSIGTAGSGDGGHC